MAHIKKVQVGQTSYLIEPTLYITPSLSSGVYSSSLTDFTLDAGVAIQVQFTDTNPANAQLEINNDIKYIYYNGNKITANIFKAGHTYTLVYDGTQWQVVGDIDTDTIYTHPTSNGNKHIPKNGSSGQFLKYSSAGTAAWADLPTASTSAAGIIQIGTDADTKAMPGNTKVDGVKTTEVGSTSDIEYKILGSAGGASLTSESIYEAVYSTGITFNPKTNTIIASKFSGALVGNATSATSANITTTSNSVAYYTNDSGTFGYKASANGALYATEANGTLSWGTLPVLQGGTGVTSFTDDCVIVSTGTPQTLVSRGLQITGGTNDSTITLTSYKTNSKLIIQPNGTGAIDIAATSGIMTISTTTGTLNIQTSSSTANKGDIVIEATGTKGTVSIESNKESVSITAGTSVSITSGGSSDISLTSAKDIILTDSSSHFVELTSVTASNVTTTYLQPGGDQTIQLGDSSDKWSKLYVGTAASYGDEYLPIYWSDGVPTHLDGVVQYQEFTIAQNTSSVTLQSEAYNQLYGIHTYVTQIVVTSGISYLKTPITWTSSQVTGSTTMGQIVLSTTTAVADTVSGYILTVRGCEAPVNI